MFCGQLHSFERNKDLSSVKTSCSGGHLAAMVLARSELRQHYSKRRLCPGAFPLVCKMSFNVHTVSWIGELTSVRKCNHCFCSGPDHLFCGQADPFGGEGGGTRDEWFRIKA